MARNRAPVVRRVNKRILANESLIGTRLISASDPDGDKITKYRIRNLFNGGGSNSAYLTLNGSRIRNGRWILVTAEQLSQLRLVSAPKGQNPARGANQIQVRAYDGRAWSSKVTSNVHTIHNRYRPVVRPEHQEVISETTISVHDIFSIFDRDGSSIKRYLVRDYNPNGDSGYLTYLGRIRNANNRRWFVVEPSKLRRLFFTAGNVALTDRIQIRAYDGRHWSLIKTILVNTLRRPTLATEPVTVLNELEQVGMPTLVQDQGSVPPIVRYEFADLNGDVLSGQVRSGFTPFAANQVHSVSAGQMNSLRFVGGRYQDRQRDQIVVRAFNGSFWSAWQSFDVLTEPHHTAALDSGENWTFYINNPSATGPLTITYSFMQRPGPDYDGAPEEDGFGRVHPELAFMVREVFGEIEQWLNVRFVEVTDLVGGTIRIGAHDQGNVSPGHAYGPADTLAAPRGGDIWFNNLVDFGVPVNWVGTYSVLDPGSLAWQMVRHYVGTSLGLKLPHQGFPLLPGNTDSNQYSVMAFNTNPQILRPKGGQNFRYAESFQLYDMATLGQQYGFRSSINAGDTTYQFDSQRHVVRTIIDSDGAEDTIDVSNQTWTGFNEGATIDLRQGAFSSFGAEFSFFLGWVPGTDNLSIAHGTEIENAIGTDSDDEITGNELDNSLVGGDGEDLLRGMSGNDFLNGQGGDDRYVYDLFGQDDVINESGATSVDTLEVWSFSDDIQSLEQAFSFRKQGDSLFVNLVLQQNNGTDLIDGTIRIRHMDQGTQGVERLRLLDMNGNSLTGLEYDLTSVYANATNVATHMKALATDGTYGKLVATV